MRGRRKEEEEEKYEEGVRLVRRKPRLSVARRLSVRDSAIADTAGQRELDEGNGQKEGGGGQGGERAWSSRQRQPIGRKAHAEPLRIHGLTEGKKVAWQGQGTAF